MLNSLEGGETEASTRGAHRCDGCPAVGVGVVALGGGEDVASVVAADGVEVEGREHRGAE